MKDADQSDMEYPKHFPAWEDAAGERGAAVEQLDGDPALHTCTDVAPLELELKYSSSFPVETLPIPQLAAGFVEDPHNNQDGKIAHLGQCPFEPESKENKAVSRLGVLHVSLSPSTTGDPTCSQIPRKYL